MNPTKFDPDDVGEGYEDPGVVSGPIENPETVSAAPSNLTIKFLQETSKFVGKELEIYGPYAPGDISTLPEDIAKVLISRGSAQEI